MSEIRRHRHACAQGHRAPRMHRRRVNSGGHRGEGHPPKAGTPDILACWLHRGACLAEAKLRKKRPIVTTRMAQDGHLSGVRVAVVHSVAEAVESSGNGSGKSEAGRQGSNLGYR